MNFNKELKELLEKYANETGTIVHSISINWYHLQMYASAQPEHRVNDFRIESEYKK